MKQEIIDVLDKWSQNSYMGGEYYGIFFRGKQLIVTKRRIYKQPGRARTELIGTLYQSVNHLLNKGKKWDDPTYIKDFNLIKKETANLVNDLIKDGIIEIKKV